ncbi:M14 family metallopeptidase [Flavobacterium agrisoli]|uniref:DUF2817 domain-containing protein n=1 Tax=Flavobacterium agrisoli TaxID=2793066 RepID=A0A934PJI0_9FLAO|nr:M14 metallopeptidase family protein [Flavobacterium agrisoli]MBK0368500.1 DUF2817 domain-containing protein [Flavobacterium agrisoli]
MDLELLFKENKEQKLFGRYITLAEVEPLLLQLNTNNQLKKVGESVLGKPIYSYTIGRGKTKIYLWSQMHGNEGTTTKALFDFFNVLHSKSEFANALLEKFTFCALPLLNPDGAEAYTRVNANEVDLNRDSQNLTQPESRILRAVFEDFKPDYCFNLHDQRTIFGAGTAGKPATTSFLAPSFNEERDINESRLKAIEVIVAINDVLQKFIPGQVGRFDDSFNINCIGDTFQNLNVPTILFEAGHYTDDYLREETRKFIFFALIASFSYLNENDLVSDAIDKYLNISQNNVVFYDFIFKNIKINYDGIEIITNFAAQYKEELIDNQIVFNAYFSQIGNLENKFGHFEYDGKGAKYSDDFGDFPRIDEMANFKLNDTIIFVNGLIKS